MIYYTEISFDIILRIASISSNNLNIFKNSRIKKELNCFCYKMSANHFKNYSPLLTGETSGGKTFFYLFEFSFMMKMNFIHFISFSLYLMCRCGGVLSSRI